MSFTFCMSETYREVHGVRVDWCVLEADDDNAEVVEQGEANDVSVILDKDHLWISALPIGFDREMAFAIPLSWTPEVLSAVAEALEQQPSIAGNLAST